MPCQTANDTDFPGAEAKSVTIPHGKPNSWMPQYSSADALKKNGNHRRRIAIRCVEASCFGVGVVLLAAYAAAQAIAVVGSEQAVVSFRLAQAEGGSPGPESAPEVDMSLWSANRVEAYRQSASAKLLPPQALLHIPGIDLIVPMFAGTAEIYLSRGVGHIEGTAGLDETGNLGIAGHRDGFFRGLKDVAVGDVVELETLDEARQYRISDISIVEPDNVEVLEDTTEATLTLVTCYPFYFVGHAPQRFIVRAVRVDPDTRQSL